MLDETHTQTAAYGGCTCAWGLTPDIVTLGKSLGGGVPVGAYGMTAELRDQLERHATRTAASPGSPPAGRRTPPAVARRGRRDAHAHPDARGFERAAALGARLADGIEAAAAPRAAWRAHRLGGRSGYCLEPELPRTADDAARSLDPGLIDARRLFMANRGIWEAIASAGPAVSLAHEEADIDAYLAVLDAFLEEGPAARPARAGARASLDADSPVFASG